MYYGCELLLFQHKLLCLQTFDRLLHVESLYPTCIQNFKPVPLTGFEILGFKLKNKNDNDKNIWKNRLFAISPMFVV